MEILSDENRHSAVVKDARLILRADRERWPVPIEVRAAVVKRLTEIVQKTETAVVDKEGGVNYDENVADKNAIAASRALAALVAQNQRDEHPQQGPKQPTINVGVQVNGNPQSGRTLASQIVERIRLGGVSSVDSGGSVVVGSGGD